MKIEIDLNKLSLGELKAFVPMLEKAQQQQEPEIEGWTGEQVTKKIKRTCRPMRKAHQKKQWTATELMDLVKSIKRKESFSSIAKRMGRTTSAVYNKYYNVLKGTISNKQKQWLTV